MNANKYRVVALALLLIWLCTISPTTFAQSNAVPSVNQSAKMTLPTAVSHSDSRVQTKILNEYGKLPLNFEKNEGQTDARVKFLSRTNGYSFFLTGDEVVLLLREGKPGINKAKSVGTAQMIQSGMGALQAGSVVRMKLRNANPAARITGMDQLPGASNYYIGNDSAKWRTNVPTYAKVKCEGIYSGIDVVYYGNQRQLEYDFIVAPGADPHRIHFDIDGDERIHRDKNGDLVLQKANGEVRWRKPFVYQEEDGTRQEIEGRYVIKGQHVGFEVGDFNSKRSLTIDPVLVYSSFLGGSMYDIGSGIVVDRAGNAYVTGTTSSADFPTMDPLQPTYGGGNYDAFVAKINPAGSALVYSTFLGGSGWDYGLGIALDSSGNAYVTGTTSSTNFPTTSSFQRIYGGGIYDAFVAEINPTGSALVYSTYLGGSGDDVGFAIAVDSSGNAHVTGYTSSTTFPTTIGAFQLTYGGGGTNAFVTEINPEGSALVYSSYLGGSGEYGDSGEGMAVDGSGNTYVAGQTNSTNFPTTPGAFRPTSSGSSFEAFVTEINPEGSALIYSSYLGGSGEDGDYGTGIAVDGSGDAFVTGRTSSSDFPTTPTAFQPNCSGNGYSAFVTEFNPTGSSLVYSTCLGGNNTYGYGIALSGSGNAYVTGQTSSTSFPNLNPSQAKYGGDTDAFVTEFNPTGSALVFSTYLGGTGSDTGFGIALDSLGNAYVIGQTYSTNFPHTHGAFQTVCNGGSACSDSDGFVSKIGSKLGFPTTSAVTSSGTPTVFGQVVNFSATVTSSTGATPTGTVAFKNANSTLGTATLSGGAASLSTSSLTVGTHSITVVYSGDATNAASTSPAISQVVNKAATTTILTSSQNPSTAGQSVTFAATITSSTSAVPTGSVTFKSGTRALGSAALVGGAANISTTALAKGSDTITATYSGSGNFTGSSATLTQQVN